MNVFESITIPLLALTKTAALKITRPKVCKVLMPAVMFDVDSDHTLRKSMFSPPRTSEVPAGLYRVHWKNATTLLSDTVTSADDEANPLLVPDEKLDNRMVHALSFVMMIWT